MSESILTSTKKILGLDESYDVFDLDIITHTNSVFNVLQQLGVGPKQGFFIQDKTQVWSDFTQSNILLNQVRTYVFLRVKLLFDPPGTSFHIEALNQQIRELEWRMNVNREEEEWALPTLP